MELCYFYGLVFIYTKGRECGCFFFMFLHVVCLVYKQNALRFIVFVLFCTRLCRIVLWDGFYNVEMVLKAGMRQDEVYMRLGSFK